MIASRIVRISRRMPKKGELTIASTGKDATTGRLSTHNYKVTGPVAIMLTTTSIEVDDELLEQIAREDPIARRDLRLILQDLAAAGSSVIVSSHILSELSDMCTSVGIMNEGSLLRHGSMASTLDSIQSETVNVRLEVVDTPDSVVAWLREQEGIEEIRVDGRRIEFRFQGDKQAQSGLLGQLVRAGFHIVSFSPRESGIESVLMSLLTEA